jgi:hypothetical protein
MTDEEEAEVYSRPYDHTLWTEHKTRVQRTIDFIVELSVDHHWERGIDLSCGDGVILSMLKHLDVIHTTYLGDRVPADWLDVVGKIEDTIELEIIPGLIMNDIMVMSETIEHLRNPDAVLQQAHDLANWLVVTTPVAETGAHGNPEHYWSWEVSDVEEMLLNAGWDIQEHELLVCPYYTYQLWGCSR